MPDPTTDPHCALTEELIRVEKLVNHFRTRGWRNHLVTQFPDVEQGSFPVLFQLTRGPARVGALAECGLSDVSTVSRHVSSLANAGLVEKVADPADGRAQVIRLTTRGRDLVKRLRERRNAWMASVVSEWPDDDVAAFTTLMSRFADDLQHTYDSSTGAAESERTAR